MMEINLTKHTVKTEELLFTDLTEMLAEDTVHITGEKEIKKIIKCCSKTTVSTKYVSDKTVTLEGTVCISIIYINSENCLAGHEHTAFFSKTVQSNVDLSGGEVSVKVTDEKCSAKLTGDNSVNLTAGANLHICVKKQSEKEMICDIDAKNIEQLKGVAQCTTPIAVGEKNLVVEEEITLGNSKPAVACIIRSNAQALIDETKIMGNKVMVKGTVKVYILYHSVEGTRPQCFEESFPFSQLIDTNGVHDGCKCDAEVKVLFCEIAPRNLGDDEIRAFTASLKLAVTVKAYCEDEIPTIIDAYATSGGYVFKKDNITFKKLKETFCDKFIAKKNLEFTDGAIGSVIDMWCEVKGYTGKFENGALKISGILLVNLLTYDIEGMPNCYERPIDFEYTYKSEETLKNPEAVFDIQVSHCSYTITGANTVSVSAEPHITVSIYDNLQTDVLTEIEKDETLENVLLNKSGIVLYFASKGEKIWDIARRYNSSTYEIKTLNSCNEDVLSAPKKFIIPTK